MKKIVISLLLIIGINLIYSQNNYYWYQNQKKYFTKVPNKYFAVFNNINDSADLVRKAPNISNIKFGTSNLNNAIVKINNESNLIETYACFNNDLPDSFSIYLKYKAPAFEISEGKIAWLTNLFYVKLKKESDYNVLLNTAQSNGVQILGKNKFMPLWYTLSCTNNSNGNAMKMANIFYESGLFAYSEPDFFIDDNIHCINDPLFSDQWGLLNIGQGNGVTGMDINICPAWQKTKGNNSIIIAVLDHGVELNHPDLTNMYPLSYDTESGTSPSKVLGNHGTACAGIIGANGNNNIGISGIAPNCPIMSISNSLVGSINSQQKRADGINFAWINGASVISNSWSSEVEYQIINDAITLALNNGRNGLGSVVIFSTGNEDRIVSYPANSNPDIIAVGAMSPCGQRKSKNPISCDGEIWGSNYGKELDVVAPGVLIPTTDRQGALGYINIDFTPNFRGTSAAAPQVAGLAGLMLSVEPELSAREVNDIIEKTAKKVGGYNYNNNRQNGTWHNEVGYGLINAADAVALAYCTDTKLHNLTFNGTQSFSDCKILSNNSIIRTGKTTYTVSKKALLNNNFEVKSDAQFEIKTW